jgi:hypothetical protein
MPDWVKLGKMKPLKVPHKNIFQMKSDDLTVLSWWLTAFRVVEIFRFASRPFDRTTRERVWLLYAWCRNATIWLMARP